METPSTLETGTAVDPRTLEPVPVRVLLLPDTEDEKQEHLVVSPDPFVAKEGQAIRWRGQKPFTLHFNGETPVEGSGELHAVRNDGWFEATSRARTDAGRAQVYKYSVSMLGNGEQIHSLDPGGVVETDPRKG
ncbi:MAG: hypothetical protein P8099_14515 [Gemmatimonadota bacterium]|jgi:hypothetical protein